LGWVCISANYRLAPAARFPEYLVDVKKAIAWARDHGHVYGADTALVFVAGSSSGGHLALLAGLTPSDPSFQPGFERADTSVAAVISLYGYYGPIDTSASRPSTPFAYVRPDAPPFFVAHGDHDTFVPVEGARRFQATLRQVSAGRVRRAARGAAHVRPVPFNPLRDADRWDRGLRGVGAFDGRAAHRGDWSRSTNRWMNAPLARPARRESD
jgi:acetyl esterase/lipase